MPARNSGKLACVGALVQCAGSPDESPRLDGEGQLTLTVTEESKDNIRPLPLEECTFERKGLRAWDVFWNESVAELEGRVLSVYDVDRSEGDEQRTLVAHAVLCDEYEVKRSSVTVLQLCLFTSTSGKCDFKFLWRFRALEAAERWLALLHAACEPESVPAVPSSATEEAIQASSADVGLSTLLADPALLASALLNPGLVGPAVLSELTIWTLTSLAGRLAVADGADEELTAEALANLAMQNEVETETTVSDHDHILNFSPKMFRTLPTLLDGSCSDVVDKAHPRPFKISAKQFSAVLLWETELDITRYIEACRGFCEVMTLLGTWTAPMISEVNKMAAMIERVTESGMGPSLREVLQSEVVAEIHQAEGVLADSSAAMGALWSYRGLMLWAEAFRGCMADGCTEAEFPRGILRSSMDNAYEKHLKPYNGLITRNAHHFSTSMMPELEDVWVKMAPTKEKLHQDVGEWLCVLDVILPRVEAALVELDLVDTRKTW